MEIICKEYLNNYLIKSFDSFDSCSILNQLDSYNSCSKVTNRSLYKV